MISYISSILYFPKIKNKELKICWEPFRKKYQAINMISIKLRKLHIRFKPPDLKLLA